MWCYSPRMSGSYYIESDESRAPVSAGIAVVQNFGEELEQRVRLRVK